MKKVGTQVLWLGCSPLNPRNGEGGFIRLSTGEIVFAYTQYVGDSWSDHANARVVCVRSRDEGRSWSEPEVLVEKPEGTKNIMSVTLLPMADGSVGLFYGCKPTDGTIRVLLRRGSQTMNDWSEAIDCTACLKPGYHVLNNERVVRLNSGRLVMPLARHELPESGEEMSAGNIRAGMIVFLLSDDDGYHWRKVEQELSFPVSVNNRGFEEPGLVQLEDGTLWCYIRTSLGRQYESFSADGGEHWTQPLPSPFFTSPRSPMLVKKLGGRVVAAFNPVPDYLGRDLTGTWGRSPFAVAVSSDGWDWSAQRVFLAEDDLTNGYCYPAMLEVEDGFLLAYYHSGGSGHCLHATRITHISWDELTEQDAGEHKM